MAIDLTAWEGYPVIWLRNQADPQKLAASHASNPALEAYCRSQDRSCARFILQPAHNDPWQFIAGVAGAVDRALGLSQEGSLRACTDGVEAAWTALINRLSDLERPLLLALDGYDHIENGAVHELVAELLEYQPVGLQIVLVCQSNPPLPLPRLRARRALLEVWID